MSVQASDSPAAQGWGWLVALLVLGAGGVGVVAFAAAERLPLLNAALNTAATVLLVCGYVAIRRGQERRHRNLMLAALVVSVLFLGSYLLHHWHAGHVRFPGQGAARAVYLVILASHVVLAAVVPVLALAVVYLGLRDRRRAHRRLARWTLPIWLYVSITGVVIYLMVYHWPG